MNSRTCQLCGKPLSRIWVGAGGDFCSREHRNQYRLRQGMGRLLEENKVASLMRRRENPKQIPAARSQQVSDIVRRGFFQVKITPSSEETSRFAPVISLRSAPRGGKLNAGAGFLVEGPKRGAAVRSTLRLPDSSGIRFGNRKAAMPRVARAQNLPAGVPRAHLARLLHGAKGVAGIRREFGMPRHGVLRVLLDAASLRIFPVGGPRAGNLGGAQRGHGISQAARSGRALRVSGAVGFRVRGPYGKEMGGTAILRSKMTWPDRLRGLTPKIYDAPAGYRFDRIDISTMSPWIPSSPASARPAELRRPAFVPYGPGSPRDFMVASHTCSTPWKLSASPVGPDMGGIAPPPSGLEARYGARIHSLPLDAVTGLENGAAKPLVELVPFEPQDSVFECSSITIHGTFGGGHGTAGPAPQPVALRIEEHFDAGWTNWVGGVEDWKLDIAGVRTGSLALFAPSLDLDDYDLEFLARIDHHSVNWVFRATNDGQYYAASIVKDADGNYELRHWASINGVTEPSAARPIKSTPKRKSAITVHTRASGDRFSVSVDGELVDSWTDNRLAVGGIGFLGAPDDRARLYWVRLSSGSTGKEFQK